MNLFINLAGRYCSLGWTWAFDMAFVAATRRLGQSELVVTKITTLRHNLLQRCHHSKVCALAYLGSCIGARRALNTAEAALA